MIPFDLSKFSVEYIFLKSITTAMGGAITTVNNQHDKMKSATRTTIPFAVARQFIKQHKLRNYLKPVPICIAKYDHIIIAIERHPLSNVGTMTINDNHWISELEKSIQKLDTKIDDTWSTDGTCIYKINDPSPIPLSADATFKAVQVDAIQFKHLTTSGSLDLTTKECIQFNTQNGDVAFSPPIWKSLATMGDRHLSNSTIRIHKHQFDNIDNLLSVNLAFALNAATKLTKLYGHDIIEPLSLDTLMVQLNTVNLPNQPTHIKNTFDIGIPFTHTIAWLLGISHNANDLKSFIVIRSILKHLTSKGIFFKSAQRKANLINDGVELVDIPLINTQLINSA